jgi:hypothetical protein
MSFFGIFGGLFNFIIFIAIANAIYKAFIKGKSGTLDQSITKFVDQVKEELNGGSTSNKTKRPGSSNTNYRVDSPKIEQTKVTDDYKFTKGAEGSYSNADDLLKSGLITKEEYRNIKRNK